MAKRILRSKIHKSKPTQYDVARQAGVSQATVSYVLNNSAAISVPEETRQRIMAVIKELGYVPDRTARSLRTSKTYTIAAIIPDITNPFYPTFVRGIQDITKQIEYDLIIYNSDGGLDEEQHCLNSIKQNQVDGLIVVPFHLSENELLDVGIPIVQLIQKPSEPPTLDSIFIDNVTAAQSVVNHLIERGHTRIGMIAGEVDTPPRKKRILGYQQAIAEHHIPLDEILIRGGDFTEKGGYETMKELLRLTPQVTAVFAANDLMAMGAITAIREAGLRVPLDIAVAGFDDIPAVRLISPPLTTVSQFQHNIGRRAAEMLFERLDRREIGPMRSIEMPFALIVRESA
jgi:LacI family transcriptional regulator